MDVEAHWDRNADRWADYVRRGWDSYREYFNKPAFFEFLGDIRGLDVLDAGCGEGYNSRHLAADADRVTGVDISSRMIEHARRAEAEDPLGIDYVVAPFEDLSAFDDATFDLVVSFMAIMDGANLDAALREIHRVLKDGGRFVFSITHPCFTTLGAGWIRDDRGREVARRVSDYFADENFTERWTFSKADLPDDTEPFSVPRFPRTLSTYLNALLTTGFTLTRVHEPRPTRSAVDEHPWLRRWRQHAALFLYIDATKQDPARGR